MGQEVIRHGLDLVQGCDDARKVSRVPQNDGGHDELEAGCAVLLVFVGAIADFAEAVNEDGTCQAVSGLALVQLLPGRPRS